MEPCAAHMGPYGAKSVHLEKVLFWARQQTRNLDIKVDTIQTIAENETKLNAPPPVTPEPVGFALTLRSGRETRPIEPEV